MRNRSKAFLALTVFMAFIGPVLFLSGTGVGGELEPPNTVPTMPTLEDIYSMVKSFAFGEFKIWEGNKRFAILENDTPEDPSDDVVWDRATNLMWTRDAYKAGKTKNWENTNSYCNNLVLVWDDWRLPTIEELASLAEAYPSPRSPALPAEHPFVNVQSTTHYWSSTVVLQPTNYVDIWRVDMNDGNVDFLHFSIWDATELLKNSYYNVWPVRGGQ